MKCENYTDAAGHPAGGFVAGVGLSILWQDGPLGHPASEPTGAQVEDVLHAAIARLEFFQASPIACEHNAEAVRHLHAALLHLKLRTADRRARGVEGTHER